MHCCPLLYSYEENSVICGKTGNLYVSVAKFLAGSVLFYAEIIFGVKKNVSSPYFSLFVWFHIVLSIFFLQKLFLLYIMPCFCSLALG